MLPPVACATQTTYFLSINLCAISPNCRYLLLSARAGFPHPTNRPIFFSYLWQTTYSASDLPSVSLLPRTHFHYPFKHPVHPLCVHLALDHFRSRSLGRLSLGKATKGVVQVSCSETKCCTPAEWCGAAQYFGQIEKRRQRIPERKDYIIIDKTH